MLALPSLQGARHVNVSVLTDEALVEACGVRVAFTGREGGVSEGEFASLNTGGHVGDDAQAVQCNRARVLEALGAADAQLVVPNQVHGAKVVRVDDVREVASVREEADAGADAVVVGVEGVAALLNFADCLPLVVVSPSGLFAVVHVGWRGAVARIASAAVAQLARGDAFAPSDYNAYIGPHIRSECFEVGPDVAVRFSAEFGEGVLEGARHVSLARAVTADLASAGLAADRIADAGICTACHPDRYFSYRATGGACGRHAAIAVRL